MRLVHVILIFALGLLSITQSVSAQYYIGKDTTIGADQSGFGYTVGFNNDVFPPVPSPCTVTVSSEGQVSYLEVFAGSTGIDDGGDIGQGSASTDTLAFANGGIGISGPNGAAASLTISSGTFSSLTAGDGRATGSSPWSAGGTVTVNGGQNDVDTNGNPVPAYFGAYGQGVFTLNSGTLNGQFTIGNHFTGNLTLFESPTVSLSGGSLTALNTARGTVTAADHATVTLSGTSIAGDFTLYNFATLQMTGGSIGGSINTNDSTTATLSGGTVAGSGYATGTSTITVSGAAFDNGGLSAAGGAVAMQSGTVSGGITASSGGTVTMSGGAVQGTLTIQDTGSSLNGTGGTAFAISVTGTGTASLQGNMVISVTGFCDGTGSELDVNGSVRFVAGSLIAADGADINAGGSVSVGDSLIAQSAGTIEFNGGTVTNDAEVSNHSVITISGGTITKGATVHDQGFFIVSGGIIGPISTTDSGTVNIVGGIITSITGAGGSTLNLNRGDVANLVTTANTTDATATSGFTCGGMESHDTSTILVQGGGILGDVNAYDSSKFYLSGGFVLGSIIGHGNATVVINGITIPNTGSVIADALDAALAGGPTGPRIELDDQSTLEIDGIAFNAELLDPADDGGMFSEYQLSGTFLDGSSLPPGLLLFVQNGTGAAFQFVAVPEPASAGLLLAAAAGLLISRRKSRNIR